MGWMTKRQRPFLYHGAYRICMHTCIQMYSVVCVDKSVWRYSCDYAHNISIYLQWMLIKIGDVMHVHTHIHIYIYVCTCMFYTHTDAHTHTPTVRIHVYVCIYIYILIYIVFFSLPIGPGMDRHLSHHAVEVGGLGRSPCSQLPSLHDAAAVGGRAALWDRLDVHGRCAALRVVWLRPLLLDSLTWGYPGDIVGISWNRCYKH